MPAIRSIPGLSALRDRSRKLLSVFAHPDDESYACAGALYRTGVDSDGAAVHLSLTRGEASSILKKGGLTPFSVGRLREERMVAVAGHAELDGLIVLDLPDSRLALTPLTTVANRIGEVIDAFEPEILIGPDPRGVNAHADHIAAHWAIRVALESRPEVRFAMVPVRDDVGPEGGGRVLPGAPVFTSNADPLVPASLLVGFVTEVSDRDLDGMPRIRLRPALDLGRATRVLVILPQ